MVWPTFALAAVASDAGDVLDAALDDAEDVAGADVVVALELELDAVVEESLLHAASTSTAAKANAVEARRMLMPLPTARTARGIARRARRRRRWLPRRRPSTRRRRRCRSPHRS